MNAEKQYIELYEQQRELIARRSAPVLNALRDEAFQCFRQSGFPGRKVERYRYTDVDAASCPTTD